MKIGKNSLQARINRIAEEENISQDILYPRFFFDVFIKRLSHSRYRDFFLLKGGLFLSSKFGVHNRSTKDIDFLVTGIDLSDPEEIVHIVDEICVGQADDNVLMKTDGYSKIRTSGTGSGIRIRIVCRLENVRQIFSIDIAMGDPVVSPWRNYPFPLMITKERTEINTYSLESTIAEKLVTLVVRGLENTRQKDLYDLFVLSRLEGEVDEGKAKEAFRKTCDFRKVKIDRKEAVRIIGYLSEDQLYKKKWDHFTKRNAFANNITFEEVMSSVMHWVNIVFFK